MKDETRMIATIVIWACFTLISGIIVAALVVTRTELNTAGIGALLILLTFLMMSVVESTKAVWGFRSDDKSDGHAKAKNVERSRLERLIAELDDDDIYDLLLARESDGEMARDRSGPRT